MNKKKIMVLLMGTLVGGVSLAGINNMPKTNNHVVLAQRTTNNEGEFAISVGAVINFDGVASSQHFEYGQSLYPHFQSQMYKSSNGDIAYCLDNGLFGANSGTNYSDTNLKVSPEVYTILANGYNGTQASLQKFTNWQEWGFTPVEGYEATQLAIWASNDANPQCRVNLNDLYATSTRGKAIIGVAKTLYYQAQKATDTLTIGGSTSNVKYIDGFQYFGPFTVNAGQPISSYSVSLSGSANAVTVGSIGGSPQSNFNSGQSFYVKVTPSNTITHVNMNVNATSQLNDGVIQSSGRNFYQNYVNATNAFVSLANQDGFDVPVPHALIVHRQHTPAPTQQTTPQVSSNNNTENQTQHQTTTNNNKPSSSVTNKNVASPKNTNSEQQHQTTKTHIDNHPSVDNHPEVDNHPKNIDKNKVTVSPDQSPVNKNNITVSPDQSTNQSNHNNVTNKITFSPQIVINNDNNNSNSNANGTGNKAIGNANSNSNSNINGNGQGSAKANSVANGGNANGAGIKAKTDSIETSGSTNGGTATTTVGTNNTSATSTSGITPASASATTVTGNKTTDLPFTGLTQKQVNSNADGNLFLALGGIFASILGVFGLRKFK